MRTARLAALAKINLDLRVLHRRPDGYHELRTVFQTISLADGIDISFAPARRTQVTLESAVEIPDNLILRAADAVLAATGRTGTLRFALRKRIPMGGGLGGGSTDAAAVLLALPVLAGQDLPWERVLEIAAELGSDVPYFLYGGTALGLGRGTELYPLPDLPARPGVLVAPGIHVSTPDAYRALGRELTSVPYSPILNTFQSLVWSLERGFLPGLAAERHGGVSNDFEPVVFRQHPRLRRLHGTLRRLGAEPARMSGSGSALFGLFPTRQEAERAAAALPGETVFPITLVTRRRYQARWRQSLREHIAMDAETSAWPLRSRYSR